MSEKTETPGTITAEEYAALTQFRAQVLAATSAATAEEALGKITAGSEALRDLQGVRAELAKVQGDLIRRDLRATLEQGLAEKRLSLGSIQKTVPLFVADEARRAEMSAAFEKLTTTTREAVLDAACSAAISAADLRTIQAYAKTAAPTVAESVVEPPRADGKDAAMLDQTSQRVADAAAEARRVADRNRPKKK